MAGNALSDSIYNEALSANDMEQRLSQAEATDLRDAQVIPVRQPVSGGSIRAAGNLSTSTETDWTRDYWRRRIVDEVILIAKQIGDQAIGRINDEQTRTAVENQIRAQLRGLAGDRLIQPGENENWFVDVYELDADTVGIDLGVTPYGIVKRVDVTITVNT